MLRSGAEIPSFLYGTAWKEERTEALVLSALRAGFVGIDTANQRKHYFEAGVGAAVQAALREGRVRREALFLQTKFTFLDGQDHRLPYERAAPVAAQVAQSFASSLEHLGTEYLDAYVLHGPSQGRGLGPADWEAWGAMEALAESGRVRYLGISNVTLEQLALLGQRARVAPAFVQNRCFARTGWDREIRALCRERGSIYQAFSLLTANTRELARPAVTRIAARLRCSVPEVVFRFATASGMLPLTGSSNPEHLRLDLASPSLALLPEELSALERLSG
ncbi:MAG TPA: aldo/keto reductase [Polyangiaceae bacterium]|nr:aldo/keto reductase [Polyangiaceae bacterium]